MASLSFHRPASPFVAGCIGSPPINLLKSTPGAPAPAPAPESVIRIAPREDRLHWFDAATGKRS